MLATKSMFCADPAFAATGGTITYIPSGDSSSGSTQVHTFLGDGTFNINRNTSCNVLCVAGGGGGSSGHYGGGGGAGGFRTAAGTSLLKHSIV